jgi:hypothetical protein
MVGLAILFVASFGWIAIGQTIQVHYDFMVKYSKLHLNSSSKNYFLVPPVYV